MKTRTSFLMIFVLMGLAVSLFGAPHTDPLDVCLSYRSSLLFLEKSSQKIETGQPIPPHNSRARARFIPAAHYSSTIEHQGEINEIQNQKNTPPDIFFYDLEVKIDPKLQRMAGTNIVHLRATSPTTELRLDLVSSLKVKRVEQNGRRLRFTQAGGEVIIFLSKELKAGQTTEVSVLYGGIPAPISGKTGLLWKQQKGKPWCSAAPGHQPESWWPCRVRNADPVDSMHLRVITPPGLMAVSQGKLKSYLKLPGSFRRWEWHIGTRLFPDQLSFAIGPYVHFIQDYKRGTQAFPLNYYALSDSREAAKRTFGELDVPGMLNCLERYLGPYPYPQAGYAFMETPTQSQGLPGLIPFSQESFEENFGPSLLRETARQWLGHRLKFNDEEAEALGKSLRAFTNVLYIECTFGKDSSLSYLSDLQLGASSSDAGFRDQAFGVWGWQNLRFQVNNDSLFFGTLRLLASRSPKKGFSGDEFYQYLEGKLAIPVRPILKQYIFVKELPMLMYSWKKKGRKFAFQYRWVSSIPDFNMDVIVWNQEQKERLGVSSDINQLDRSARDKENISFDGQRVWFLVKEVKKLER